MHRQYRAYARPNPAASRQPPAVIDQRAEPSTQLPRGALHAHSRRGRNGLSAKAPQTAEPSRATQVGAGHLRGERRIQNSHAPLNLRKTPGSRTPWPLAAWRRALPRWGGPAPHITSARRARPAHYFRPAVPPNAPPSPAVPPRTSLPPDGPTQRPSQPGGPPPATQRPGGPAPLTSTSRRYGGRAVVKCSSLPRCLLLPPPSSLGRGEGGDAKVGGRQDADIGQGT